MSADPFVNAAPANVEFSKVKIADYHGELILFEATEHKQDFPTENGPKDPIVADIAVLSDKGVEEHSGVLIFQGRLVSKLKNHVGGAPYLGVLTRDEKGRNQPWQLEPANEAQKDLARKYLNDRAAAKSDPFAKN